MPNAVSQHICDLHQRVGEIEPGGQFYQHAYVQLLHAQIPKAQKAA